MRVSPEPIEVVGPSPDGPHTGWAMYPTPSARYHADTIVAVPKALATRLRRIVVKDEEYDPDPIPVPYVP